LDPIEPPTIDPAIEPIIDPIIVPKPGPPIRNPTVNPIATPTDDPIIAPITSFLLKVGFIDLFIGIPFLGFFSFSARIQENKAL